MVRCGPGPSIATSHLDRLFGKLEEIPFIVSALDGDVTSEDVEDGRVTGVPPTRELRAEDVRITDRKHGLTSVLQTMRTLGMALNSAAARPSRLDWK
jgi:hypothetical protein